MSPWFRDYSFNTKYIWSNHWLSGDMFVRFPGSTSVQVISGLYDNKYSSRPEKSSIYLGGLSYLSLQTCVLPLFHFKRQASGCGCGGPQGWGLTRASRDLWVSRQGNVWIKGLSLDIQSCHTSWGEFGVLGYIFLGSSHTEPQEVCPGCL